MPEDQTLPAHWPQKVTSKTFCSVSHSLGLKRGDVALETYNVVVLDEVVKGAARKVGHRLAPVRRVGRAAGRNIGRDGVAREVPDLDAALVPERGVDTAAGVVEAGTVRVGGVAGDSATCGALSKRLKGMGAQCRTVIGGVGIAVGVSGGSRLAPLSDGDSTASSCVQRHLIHLLIVHSLQTW